MEEKQLSGAHRLWIAGRKNGEVSGVSDVLSFDENEIVMDTDMGMLTIRGKGLHISKLNLEKGEAELEGQVDSLVYSAKGHKRKRSPKASFNYDIAVQQFQADNCCQRM